MSDGTENELPRGWAWTPLDELALSVRNGISTRPNAASGTRILRISAVRPGALNLDDVRFLDEPYVNYEKYHLQQGDLLFTRYNGNAELVGAAAMVPSDAGDVVYPDKLIRVRLDRDVVEPTFVASAVRVGASRRHIRDHSKTAAGQVGISGRDLKLTPLAIAPLNEQRRIVAKIDALQARSRRAREALDAIPALLDRFRQSVLAAAFRGDLTADWRAKHPDVEPASVLLERIRAERKVRWIEAEAEKARARAEARAVKKGQAWGPEQDAKALAAGRVKAEKKYEAPEPVDAEAEGLPELPEGWCWARMAEVARVLDPNPSHRYPSYDGGSIPLLATQEFVGLNEWDHATAKLVATDFFEAQRQRCDFRANDVIMARKGRLGLARRPPSLEQYTFSHTVFVVKGSPLIDSELLLWRLRQDSTIEWYSREMNTNTGVPTLGKTTTEALPIPLPSRAEQSIAFARVSELYDRATSVEASLAGQLGLLDTLDQSILAKAFRGELVPQDPDDEPASVLLERIRAEREAAAPKKSRRSRR